MARRKKKFAPDQIVKMESLKQLNLNAAGLDIAAAEIWVAVPTDRAEVSVRVFPTFTPDLQALADWLLACGVDTVAMESTGVYWIPIYEILEALGMEVLLVNARHVKNVTGRKSDILDCQWLQQLHTYGLLQGSFRPSAEITTLRTYVRQRENLIRYRAGHIQHIQKALHLMNVQLPNVLTDITGKTGMLIIRAIVAGERNPVTLAQFRNPHCKSSREDMAKALTGNYRPEHVFALQQAVELYDFYAQQIRACDCEIERLYHSFSPQVDLQTLPLAKKTRRKSKNAPVFDLRSQLYQTCGVDLTQVDGLDSVLVQDIIAEIGTDMTRWPTVKHFSAWLRLSPNNTLSGGKVLSRHTQKSANRAAMAFRLAAQSVSRSQSAQGAFFRRLRAKHGAPKAITATAHKIARIVYHLLLNQEEYQDPGQDYYEQQFRHRVIKNLERKAKKLGLILIPNPSQLPELALESLVS
jgi:transposase